MDEALNYILLDNDASSKIEIREQGGNRKVVLVVLHGDEAMEFDLSSLQFWTVSPTKKP